ncbi:MAG TPA: hypothetical protein VFV99_11800 [Kofleriaceae bacterium]|nr:hypothetical protein [Kofleriaceae bacterium]
MRLLLLLVLFAGCRAGFYSWQVAPPNSAPKIKIALNAVDANASGVARPVLQQIGRVQIFDVAPIVRDRLATECTNESCQLAIACQWSTQHGATYYARASVAATAGAYVLDVYDVNGCKRVPALSQELGGQAQPAHAEPEGQPPGQTPPVPEQPTIGKNGIEGAPGDGYYALFRGNKYLGEVHVRDAGSPDEKVRAMHYGTKPMVGDLLDPRGIRRFVDVALSAGAAWAFSEPMLGLGAHLRFYSFEGGLQVGFTGELLFHDDDFVGVFTGEVGYGWPIAPGLILSGNLGAGTVTTHYYRPELEFPLGGRGSQLTPLVRLQTFFVGSYYATLDVGVILTDDADKLDLPAAQIPFLRLSLGADVRSSASEKNSHARRAAAARATTPTSAR